MSILIKGINMPEGEGCKLVLQIFPNGEIRDEHGIRLGITSWAEAVPVPPHGRLIDADALPRYTGYALSANEVAMAVETAPTIIEEEGCGK